MKFNILHITKKNVASLALFCCILFNLQPISAHADEPWQGLAKGLELGSFSTAPMQENMLILRIQPKHWKFSIRSTSEQENRQAMTARAWAETFDFTATINAGMFHLDHQKHVGYLKQDKHINSQTMNAYQSIAAFEPYNGKAPFFQMLDTDTHKNNVKDLIQHYRYVVQNLRLIKHPAINRWQEKQKKWREAALAIDQQGRVLFIYSPTPYTMHDFNALLLSFGIDIVSAQHLEGGLQAQLFINSATLNLQKMDQPTRKILAQQKQRLAWNIPFILGIEPR